MPVGQIIEEIDHNAHLLVIRIVGAVSDDRALRDIPRIWERHPEIRTYESIIDARFDEGTISWNAISEIAEKWNAFAGAEVGHRTAVVVRGELWEPIVKMVASRFPQRRFEAFRSMEDAQRWVSTGASSD